MNYWVDAVIAAAFSVSAVSGLVFLLPVGQGSVRVLGLSYRIWMHCTSGATSSMIAGVLLHLVLHSKWIACMTQSVFGKRRRVQKGG